MERNKMMKMGEFATDEERSRELRQRMPACRPKDSGISGLLEHEKGCFGDRMRGVSL